MSTSSMKDLSGRNIQAVRRCCPSKMSQLEALHEICLKIILWLSLLAPTVIRMEMYPGWDNLRRKLTCQSFQKKIRIPRKIKMNQIRSLLHTLIILAMRSPLLFQKSLVKMLFLLRIEKLAHLMKMLSKLICPPLSKYAMRRTVLTKIRTLLQQDP